MKGRDEVVLVEPPAVGVALGGVHDVVGDAEYDSGHEHG